MALTKAVPHLRVVVQDIESVIEQAYEVWERDAPGAIATGRAQLVPVDFLVTTPLEGCEFYHLKHVLHDWPDADCVTILRNTRKAMKNPRAKVLIQEIILSHTAEDGQNDQHQAPFPLLPNYGVGAQRKYNQDIYMLATFNGRERTLDEFIDIGTAAGLKYVKLWEGGDTAIIELEAAQRLGTP